MINSTKQQKNAACDCRESMKINKKKSLLQLENKTFEEEKFN